MKEKTNKFAGYILLDSIVALSLLSIFVVMYLSWSLNIQKQREARTIELEAYRMLYEASATYREFGHVLDNSKVVSKQSISLINAGSSDRQMQVQAGEMLYEVYRKN